MGWKMQSLPPALLQRVQEATAKKKPEQSAPREAPAAKDVVAVDIPRAERQGDVLTVWMDPMGAPRQAPSDKWNPSDAVLRYRAFKDRLRPVVPVDLLEHCYGFDCEVYFRIPKSWSIKDKVCLAGQPHRDKPDIDNIWKCLTDCLFPGSDSHIHTGHMSKFWDDGNGPRLVLKFSRSMPIANLEIKIRKALEVARATGKPLKLTRYYSTDGQKCSTLVVRLLPEGGYDQLVQASIEEFKANEETLKAELRAKFPGNDALVDQCCKEQMAAWEKRARGEVSEHNKVAGYEELTGTPHGYSLKPSDPFMTVVFGLERLEEEVHSERASTGTGNAGKTRIKYAMKHELPLGKFIGRLNLSADTVVDVEVLEDYCIS